MEKPSKGLRFFFDECTDEDIAGALRAIGLDVVTAADLNRKGLSDQEQLDFCKKENRVLYTVDKDFLRIAASGENHCGIVYHAPQARTKRQIIDDLVLLAGVCEPQDMVNHVEYIKPL